MSLRPRLPVADIESRGRRRRNRHRALGATTAVAAIALIVAGSELFAGDPEPTTDIGGGARTTVPAPPPPPTTAPTTAVPTTPPESEPEPDPSMEAAGAPVALTVLPPFNPREAFPSAIVIGTLLMEDHCVFLRLDDGQRRLVVWKDGTRLDTTGPAPVVLAPDGTVIGTGGDTVSLAGGETPPDALSQLDVVGLRRSCLTPTVIYTSGPA